MRTIVGVSGLWIVANLVLFAGPELFGRWTGWYMYVNPWWQWYVWLLGPPAVLLMLWGSWRLLRRRQSGA